mmetsp:Transcript_3992/g.11350  ORF Transcript_3992/g.11350 Transcript_3992/m.11350 type:complete len:212 (-) Transcript_3992:2552-3187(-)
MQMMKTKVIYSPQPDEPQDSSAAYEYAKRISYLLNGGGPPSTSSSSAEAESGGGGDTNAIVVVERLTLESLDFLTKSQGDERKGCTHCIFIISCSADGSVDRIVRKLIRSLKNNNNDDNAVSASQASKSIPKVAIALLGHARCENSANQMRDTIFGNGRKFRKAVMGWSKANASENSGNKLSSGESLEVQVELEGPDSPGGFDEWIKRIVQ